MKRNDGHMGALSGIGNLMARFDNGQSWHLKSPNRICLKCRFVSKGTHCPYCRIEMTVMDYWCRARPPRKGASKAKWDKFYKQFNLRQGKKFNILRNYLR